jgi:hypothetical protein
MLRILIVSVALAVAAPLGAQENKPAKKEPTAQQKRHAECNRQSAKKELRGVARKKFMTECLKT